MKIAVDLMGGDHAPQAVAEAVLQMAGAAPQQEYIVVGLEAAVSAYAWPANVTTLICGSVMGMDEDVRSLMRKKDSSIWMATDLVKRGEAAAVVSAGSTGAQMAVATLLLGRIKGCSRPAIATVIPSEPTVKVLLDAGANADCEPEMLLQFARMGAVYARLLGVHQPQVAQLANGTEPHKGNKLLRDAYALLEGSELRFIGNLEGRDILTGAYDVLVCDGLSGNIAIKTIEGTMSFLMAQLREQLTATAPRKLGAALVRPGLRAVKKKLDYEEHGGAPLLGVNGVSLVCHGSSTPRALVSALRAAAQCVEQNFVAQLQQALEDEHESTPPDGAKAE